MQNTADKDAFIETLLQERDELYQELSKLRQADGGALEKAEKKNAHYEKVIKEKDLIINKLTDQLAWFRRKFWKPSSEKYIPTDPAQRKLDFDGIDILPEEETVIKASANEIITYKRTRVEREKKQPVRMPLPEHLRREEEVIEPEGIDENWVRIGEEVTEQLENKPGELYVRRIIRPKYALKKDLQLVHEVSGEEGQEKAVKIAPLPLLPLPRSNAGASLLAELIMSKYMYHLPFHRQLAMFKLEGIKIPASTVNDWFVGCGDLLRALYYRLKEIVLESDYIQVDESTVPVINNEKHRAVKAYLWVVRSVMKNLVFFHYDKGSRAQRVVIELLRDYKGAVQTDGYEAYSIYENKKGVLLLSCWAHARRKFNEALKEDQSGATYALEQISLLYGVESMAEDQELDYQQRAELRSRLAYPILLGFEKWIVSYMPKALPKGRMSQALTYTYSLFHRLSRYHLDGRYKIDNNLVENTIRPLALGRKNYMFCGNHDAAENAAIMYSLLGCCAALDVNPREWLTDVLTRIPYYNNDYSRDLAELLPHNWKAGQVLQNSPLEIQ
ncbi:MAG: IS66 family transposase [Bacteroidales bacterium]|nr:IS66 family transposase [Bacteroidales bacterium]